jgi:hypothetical protein
MLADPWYYLSEMSVSNRHGGGLTLQRIVGEDLERFCLFVHLDSFSVREPIVRKLESRQLNLHELYPVTRPGSYHYYVQRMLEKVGLEPHVDYIWGSRIRRSAAHIAKRLPLTDARWLVVPQSMLAVRVLNRVLDHRPVDYVTWLMDDHVVRWQGGWNYPDSFEAEFRRHLLAARKICVISPAMAHFYKDRFGVDSVVLFGPADPIGPPVYLSADPSGPVRLCYFGAIWPWQRDALERFAACLSRLNAELDVFTFADAATIGAMAGVTLREPIPPDDVIRRMRDYDGVLIAVSFDDASRGLAELNISTKMSECLASGTVVVVVGPEYAAMVKFVRERAAGVVVTDLNDSIQMSALKGLKEEAFRRSVLARARRTVEDTCSVEAMRTTWKKCWYPSDMAKRNG